MESLEKTVLVLPNAAEVLASLVSAWAGIDWADVAKHNGPEERSVDVRLQVLATDSWDLHTGDASFDQDHRGHWGASSLNKGDTLDTLAQTARDLLAEVGECAAQTLGPDTVKDAPGRLSALFKVKGGFRLGETWDDGRTWIPAGFSPIVKKLADATEYYGGAVEAPYCVRARAEDRRRNKENKRRDRMREARDAYVLASKDEEREEFAEGILRGNYWGHVRRLAEGMAQEVTEDVKGGKDFDESVAERLHETVDGSAMVIYTAQNFEVLRWSSNHDAYTEEMGEVPTSNGSVNWAALAFSALAADVRDNFERVHAEGIRAIAEKGDESD